MEVIGTAVRSTALFVRKTNKNRFDEWVDTLSPRARGIATAKIVPSAWYPLEEGMVEPTRKICELFYDGDIRGAREIGRFSADYSLWGLFRLFVRIGSPQFLIRRASVVFSSYYQPSQMTVKTLEDKRAIVQIVEFPDPSDLVEARIGGWIERALKISGCEEVQCKYISSLTRGDPSSEFVAEWR